MRLSGRGVRCVRGGREVFSGLDFEVSSGDALAVTGPNGAGKTSLLRIMAGLLTAADGSIGLEDGEVELTLPEQSRLYELNTPSHVRACTALVARLCDDVRRV